MTPEQMEAAELAGTLKRLDEWRKAGVVYGRTARLEFDGGWTCLLARTNNRWQEPRQNVQGDPHVLLHLAIESALARWREPEGGK